jgi:hypothetical protein
MKNPATAIFISTLYLFLFQASPYLRFPDELIIAMFIVSPFVIIYVVSVVLKYGKPSKYSFDEKFYEDLDYERVN